MSNQFSAQNVANYHQGPLRQVPGYEGLLRMSTMLLAESIGDTGEVLVLGAGGGLEIRAMADEHTGWAFEGIDPSQEMIDLAIETTAHVSDRVAYRTGYIDSATNKTFDGATCILTMHFVLLENRLETLRQIHLRLKPQAPFIMSHISFSQHEPERSRWIERHVDFGGVAPENREAAIHAIGTRLTILSPEDEEAMLQQAGFTNIAPFYQGLSFRGWLAYAS